MLRLCLQTEICSDSDKDFPLLEHSQTPPLSDKIKAKEVNHRRQKSMNKFQRTPVVSSGKCGKSKISAATGSWITLK